MEHLRIVIDRPAPVPPRPVGVVIDEETGERFLADPISGKLIPEHKALAIERARQAAVRRYGEDRRKLVNDAIDRFGRRATDGQS